MGDVDVVIGAVVVVLLLAGGALVFWRRGESETHSVDGYRHTLDTLQEIGTRTSSRSVRIIGRPGERDRAAEGDAAEDDGGEAGPTPVRGTAAGPRGYVFDDAGPSGGLPTRPAPRVQTRALTAMNHRPRRLAGPIAVAVVVLAVLGLVVALGARARPPRAAAPPRGGTATSQTVALPAGQGGAGGGAKTAPSTTPPTTGMSPHRSSGGHTGTTPTTAAAVPTKFKALDATPTSATYAPPAASYTITITTTNGECWITVSSSSGATLMSQTLAVGVSRAVPATGVTTVILGAPSAVTITVDHEPVILPTGYQTPFHITFQPASP
jgi:hypothetical protein